MSWVEIGYYLALSASILGVLAVFVPVMTKELTHMIREASDKS